MAEPVLKLNGYTDPKDAIAQLRGTVDGVFQEMSGMASSLLPLLQALDWKGTTREIAEALPHFVSEIELVDLRNALVNLGFETYAKPLRLSQLDPRLAPFLFVTENPDGKEDVRVVLEAEGSHISLWHKGDISGLAFSEADIEGTAYYITRTEDRDVSEKPHIFGWTGRILGRFNRRIRMLFAVSLFSNVIGIAFPIFIMFIYDSVIRMHSIGTLPMLVLGVLMFLATDAALRYIRAKIIGFIAGRLDYILGSKTFERIFGLAPAYTERAAVSVQLARIKEFESIRDFFTGPLVGAAIDLPFVFIAVAVVAVLAGPLAFVPLATVLAYLGLALLLLPSSRQLKKEASAASGRRDDVMVETLLTRKSIKDTAAEGIWLERYRLASAEASRQRQRTENHETMMDALCHMIQMLSGLAILAWGTVLVINGAISIGALIATMILSWKMLAPIQSGFLAYTKFDQILGAVRQLNNLMSLRSEGNAGKARLLVNEIKGTIAFDRVSFRYTQETDPALLGATFRIEQNTTVAITGTTSSGKTTLVKLLLGLYQPQGGSISVGGLDLRQIDPRDLRCKIGYAPQDLQFFYGTIAQNMRLAEPTATDNEIERALRCVGLWDEIDRLPEKLKTRLNANANRDFDPGFLQRLNIARALLRDTPILMLDEPAQRLDYAGDAALIDHLRYLHGKKTIVMITHRPSHIWLADKVIVMNRGMVEFEGAPQDALEFNRALNARAR